MRSLLLCRKDRTDCRAEDGLEHQQLPSNLQSEQKCRRSMIVAHTPVGRSLAATITREERDEEGSSWVARQRLAPRLPVEPGSRKQDKRMVVDDHGIVHFVSRNEARAAEEMAAKGLTDLPVQGISNTDWEAIQSLRR